MELKLEGKIAIVTGAGSPRGFGHTIALTLAREGCNLVANDLNIETAEKTAAEIRGLGRQALAIRADVASATDVSQMVKTTLDKFGKIDILVNNAGMLSPMKPFVEYTDAEWNREIDVDLKGVMICTKAVLNHMIQRRMGKIINISSGAGKVGGAHYTAYSAAKAGVIGFTKGLACEVAALGINVNSVAPGLANTGILDNASQKVIQETTAAIPLGRLIQTQAIANMVAFLASDVASDIVGQAFSVDGGRVRM